MINRCSIIRYWLSVTYHLLMQKAPLPHRVTSVLGLVFCSVQSSDSAKVKPKSEVDFFVWT